MGGLISRRESTAPVRLSCAWSVPCAVPVQPSLDSTRLAAHRRRPGARRRREAPARPLARVVVDRAFRDPVRAPRREAEIAETGFRLPRWTPVAETFGYRARLWSRGTGEYGANNKDTQAKCEPSGDRGPRGLSRFRGDLDDIGSPLSCRPREDGARRIAQRTAGVHDSGVGALARACRRCSGHDAI